MLAEATDLSSLDPRHRPLPAVLDTDFIRTGLHAQLSKGMPPRSIRTARGGSLRLFMEYDTLLETNERLPKFADQLGASVPELRRILNEDWLPHIDVVQLPAGLRELDPRALRVRDGDGVRLGDVDDFPAAALAALLSPCLLLTHNYKHFGALGVQTRMQGVDGVMAVLAINIGEVQLQAVIFIPSLPFRVVGVAMEWATEKIGPLAWVILGAGVAGGIVWYCKQPPERRDQINKVAGDIATASCGTTARPRTGSIRPACSYGLAWSPSRSTGLPRRPSCGSWRSPRSRCRLPGSRSCWIRLSGPRLPKSAPS